MRRRRWTWALFAVGAGVLAVPAGSLSSLETTDTSGFRLKPPVAFADFRMTDRHEGPYVGVPKCAGGPAAPNCLRSTRPDAPGPGITPEDADRIVKGATGTGADYTRLSKYPEFQDTLVFRGLQGEVSDPGAAARRMLRSIERNEQVPFRQSPDMEWQLSAESFPIEGAPEAVMICRSSGYSELFGTEIVGWRSETCVWADRSTVAATRTQGIDLKELAALTAELHRTARVRR
ncbi:hypothetical protein [Streptomyces sudanensis]|uniref:hypothetical protein n=1 Tax=Streptomyces sudanensis TaxID=436397 RepID=UPI0020CBBFCF|nr:hypothetical protein [Streptomyces sudanensis]MCP9958929.1 hypothetical protein [Streptomyces sudanensis]MCQ0000594.1 hypothetical protein [Streptomyces sudanensis]